MLASVSAGAVVGLVLSSAVVASIVSGLFSLGVSAKDGDERRKVRTADAARETREHSYQLAKTAHNWIIHDLAERFGSDIGYHGYDARKPTYNQVSQMLSTLDTIATTHPDADMRTLAKRLWADIDDRVNMIQGDPEDLDPHEDELRDWIDRAESLFERIRDSEPSE
jgi:hypothetical protein